MEASPHQRLYVDSWGHFLAVTQRVTLTYILYNKSSIKHTEFTITTKRWSCSHLCVYNPTITRVTGAFKPSETGQVKQMFSGNQLTCHHRNNRSRWVSTAPPPHKQVPTGPGLHRTRSETHPSFSKCSVVRVCCRASPSPDCASSGRRRLSWPPWSRPRV